MSKTTASSRFRDRLKELREGKGWRQEDLAKVVGTERSTVSQWETGEAVPELQRLDAIAEVLGCDVADLFSPVSGPAGSRPLSMVRDCDTVEVPVGVLRFLRDFAVCAVRGTTYADERMARVRAEDPSLTDEVVSARAAILCVGQNSASIQSAIDRLIPEDES